jgi:hypothetical protein
MLAGVYFLHVVMGLTLWARVFFLGSPPTPKRAIGFRRAASAVKQEVRRKWFAQQISELYRVRKAALASILRQSRHGVRLNEHLQHGCGLAVFQHACKMGLEGIV